MKFKKIIRKAEQLWNPDKEEKRKKRIKSIKKLLKKLRAHEKALQKELKKLDNQTGRHKIQNKIDLTHAQRKKGVAALKKLKKED